MLWFLNFAAKAGYQVDSYIDEAVGVMAKNAEGRLAMTQVTLHPKVSFSGSKRPGSQEFASLHHQAHEACFIANSVRSEVRCAPQIVQEPA
jgi:organic hydroperoxide reductase OsmC/OhrA